MNSIRSVNQRQVLNIAFTCLLGVLLACWIGFIYQPLLQGFSVIQLRLMALFLGGTAATAGWSLTIAEKPGSQLFLLFLVSILVCGTVLTALAFPKGRLFLLTGLGASLGLVVSIPALNGPNHQIFVLLWLSILGLTAILLYGVVWSVTSSVSIYPIFAAVVFVFVLKQAHLVLIRERELKMGP